MKLKTKTKTKTKGGYHAFFFRKLAFCNLLAWVAFQFSITTFILFHVTKKKKKTVAKQGCIHVFAQLQDLKFLLLRHGLTIFILTCLKKSLIFFLHTAWISWITSDSKSVELSYRRTDESRSNQFPDQKISSSPRNKGDYFEEDTQGRILIWKWGQ